MLSAKKPEAKVRTKRNTTFCVLIDPPPSVTLFRLAHRLRQRRHDLEHVAYDTIVGDLEDGRLPVLVDRDDRLRRAHTREVLDGAGDTNRDVELRAYLSSSLTDLVGMRAPALVSHRARRANGGFAECIGELLDELEVLGSFEPASSRHNY